MKSREKIVTDKKRGYTILHQKEQRKVAEGLIRADIYQSNAAAVRRPVIFFR
jgi:hypothetical protein